MAEPIKTVNEEGRAVIVHDSGLIQDAQSGKIVHPPEHGIIRTSEQGREVANRRWDRLSQEFLEGAYEEFIDGNIPDPDEMTLKEAREIGKIVARAIKDPKYTNRLAENVRVFAELGRLMPSKKEIELTVNNSAYEEGYKAGQMDLLIKVQRLLEAADIQKNAAINGEEIKGE